MRRSSVGPLVVFLLGTVLGSLSVAGVAQILQYLAPNRSLLLLGSALVLLLFARRRDFSLTGYVVPDRLIRSGRRTTAAGLFGVALAGGVVKQTTGAWTAYVLLLAVSTNYVATAGLIELVALVRSLSVIAVFTSSDLAVASRRLDLVTRQPTKLVILLLQVPVAGFLVASV